MNAARSAAVCSCCFRACTAAAEQPTLRLEIHPPPDADPITVWAHEECFHALRNRAVEPDRPGDHGRIPGKASCVFCGERLPIVGKHPYCLDVGKLSPPRRYWAHAGCLEERVGRLTGGVTRE